MHYGEILAVGVLVMGLVAMIYDLLRDLAIAVLRPSVLTTVPVLVQPKHRADLRVEITVNAHPHHPTCDLSVRNSSATLCQAHVDGYVLGMHSRSTLVHVVVDFLRACSTMAERNRMPLVYIVRGFDQLLALSRLVEAQRQPPLEQIMKELGYRLVFANIPE